MTERLRLAGGFTRLLQGTEADETAGRQGVGVALTTDRGYIFVPNNMGGDNVVFTDYCRDNDILLVHPFKEGEGAFHHDPITDTFVFDVNQEDEVGEISMARQCHPNIQVFCKNSGRIGTYLRPSVEQCHAALFQYKVCDIFLSA